MAVSDKGGNVVYRFVYDTYGELSDIQNANRISLQTAEEAQEYTLTELADAAGIEYLYNGKYGVTTDSNGLYYMRARYYNQDIKRFINRDVLSGDITNSQSLNRYCYVQGNPVSLTDPFGLCPTEEEIRKIELRRAVHTTLDVIGIFFDGADVLNGILYALEGDNVNAALCLVFFIPGVGSAVGLTAKYVFKIGGNAGEAIAKFVKKYAPELAENGGKFVRNVGGKLDDAGKWIGKKIEKIGLKSTPNITNSGIENIGDSVIKPDGTRINLANGRTRFTPLRNNGNPVSAGMQHVIDGHFNRPLGNNRSVFSISVDYLKEILQRKDIVSSSLTDIGGGQYQRIVDTGEIIGNTALKYGGNETSWIKIITDIKGNIITTYPVPKP